MIQWANPKSNRLYLIECRLCGGAAFGYWGRWDEGHAKITAIPDFNRYCEIHKMTPDTIYEHGLCYREIVLDKRMLRKCNDIHCILISPGHAGLMKERADAVEELKHYHGFSWLLAEEKSRFSVLNATPLNFVG